MTNVHQPKNVNRAILIIWITIAVSAVGSLLAKVLGLASESEFAGNLFACALICIIPYKLSNRSNATRYVYSVLLALNLFLIFGLSIPINKVEIYLSVLTIPAQIYAAVQLFGSQASEWFSSQQD